MTRDLIVLSDLHLGRGRNPETGRFHRLEAFLYDDDFEAFCGWLIEDAGARGRGLRLVMNGDTFDLLRIEPEAGGPADPTVGLIRAILAGHPRFVGALARLLAAGHELVLLPGNHDLELQRAVVQAEVRAAIEAALAAQAADPRVVARLHFEPWFHHEPGRIWIEHGSQYDPEGAFRYLLRGRSDARDVPQDTPLGNFFQRYLYNALGSITFVVPSTDANFDYLRWLALHRPRRLARALARHLPFALRLISRVGRAAQGVPPALARGHADELDALAERSGLGEAVHAIDGLKVVGDLGDAARRTARQILRALGVSFLIALLALGVWSVGQLAIATLRVGLAPKAALSLALGFVMLAIGGVGMLVFFLRPSPPRARGLRTAAGKIAALARVPIVTFGHTHAEDVARVGVDHTGWYYNTGTWLGVFLGDGMVPRERVQLTFLRVTDATGELLHFSAARGRPLPVVLVER